MTRPTLMLKCVPATVWASIAPLRAQYTRRFSEALTHGEARRAT